MEYGFDLSGLQEKEREAFRELAGILGVKEAGAQEGGIALRFGQGRCLSARKTAGSWTITFAHENEKWRAFSRALEEEGDFEEPAGKDLQAMLDCSRNGVLTPEAVKRMIRHLALMGYRAVQLYTEDTYEIEGEPYFGYQRGRYTREELREIDRYAGRFGLEIIPCIQTLAHLERVLHWQAYQEVKDCDYILLAEIPVKEPWQAMADEEKTYALIDRMFSAMEESLSSRRINIGMDEAHALGLGKYLDRFGYRDRMSIMTRHFNRVWEIAKAHGYAPMMWSDMFFRLACGGEYYAGEFDVAPGVKEQIPDGLTLVYWDYYSLQKETYDGMLKSHRKLTDHLAFAGGVWTWTGYCPNSFYSRHIAPLAYESCRENGIDTILATAWGDDGTETSLFSALPALQQWAELTYEKGGDEEMLERRFRTSTGASYRAFLELGRPALTPDNPMPGGCGVNPLKYLLYQDVLGGLFDAHTDERYEEHFSACARMLEAAKREAGDYGYLFELEERLCRLLARKATVGKRLRTAYKAGDKEGVRELAQRELSEILLLTGRFEEKMNERWKRENKIFGLDVLHLRLGGLKERLNFARERLLSWAEGETGKLEEMESAPLAYRKEKDMAPPCWRDIVTACNV